MSRIAPDTSKEKRCSRCQQIKPPTEFYKQKRTFDGLQGTCKKCQAKNHGAWRRENLPKLRDASKKWREANPVLARDHGLKTRYGLPLGGYNKLHEAQNGLCAICGKPSTKGRGVLHVDHCHQSGRIRGLLCHGCNVSLGHFNHSIQMLEAAIKYLSRT